MDNAPKDGSRVLIQAVCYGYVPERQGSHFRMHKPIGNRWVECRWVDGRWQEWLGREDRWCTGTITALAWAPLPC